MALAAWNGGQLSGKVDGLIFQKWKDIHYVRSTFIPRNPRTEKQQAHRNEFSLMTKIATTIYRQWYRKYFPERFSQAEFNQLLSKNKALYPELPAAFAKLWFPFDFVPDLDIEDVSASETGDKIYIGIDIVQEVETFEETVKFERSVVALYNTVRKEMFCVICVPDFSQGGEYYWVDGGSAAIMPTEWKKEKLFVLQQYVNENGLTPMYIKPFTYR